MLIKTRLSWYYKFIVIGELLLGNNEHHLLEDFELEVETKFGKEHGMCVDFRAEKMGGFGLDGSFTCGYLIIYYVCIYSCL